ncbi:MAG: undecaprenyl-diphosphate phosphatase [Clostridia bacterium]|nr:undecaprenyl-diphosphate phosphatase [Clostridia bacterium]
MAVIEYLKAILFGIVEGITEWLPISSTGHMILLDELVELKVSEDFYGMFQVVIQLGAIMAVVLLFWNKIFPLGKKEKGIYIKKDIMSLWGKILVACVPAAVVGLLFDEYFEALFYNPTSVAIALIVFGVAFIVIETVNKGKNAKVSSMDELTYKLALIIGLFQLIAAVFPGTSRSGATIVGALLIGVSRVVAAEFTFYLAIPVMFGASLLKIVKFGFDFTGTELAILAIGMITAFAVSLFVIKFLMGYIKKHDFKVFGWYRIVLGIVVLVYLHLRHKNRSVNENWQRSCFLCQFVI